MERVPSPHARPVRLLRRRHDRDAGTHAVRSSTARRWSRRSPRCATFRAADRDVLSLPGPQISPGAARAGAPRPRGRSGGGGVVISTGTDTLEELAMLCALTYGGEDARSVHRRQPAASRAGADGPANLLDAVSLAAAPAAAGSAYGRVRRRYPRRTDRAQVDPPARRAVRVAGRRTVSADRRGSRVAARPPIRPAPVTRPALPPRRHPHRHARRRRSPLAAPRGPPTRLVMSAFGAGHVTPGMLARSGSRSSDPGRAHRRPSAARCCTPPTALRDPSAICGPAA